MQRVVLKHAVDSSQLPSGKTRTRFLLGCCNAEGDKHHQHDAQEHTDANENHVRSRVRAAQRRARGNVSHATVRASVARQAAARLCAVRLRALPVAAAVRRCLTGTAAAHDFVRAANVFLGRTEAAAQGYVTSTAIV